MRDVYKRQPLLSPSEDDLVLDMCCAPGSKTTHLAALMNNKGKIIACDLFEHKIKLVKENLKRLNISNVELHAIDATTLKMCIRDRSNICKHCFRITVFVFN